MTDKITLSREQVEKCLRDALIIRFHTDSHVEALRAALSNQSAPADKGCSHRFMSLADDPRRCADCDAVEPHDKPVVRLELVRSGMSEGLHIRVWENLGNLWPGVHELYLGPADKRPGVPVAFQARVKPWMLECFGETISRDRQERNHRFLEEALELVQSSGCAPGEAHQLVEYVYGRPAGDPVQEVGGVMVTLAALCLAHGMDMHAAGETELSRIWTKVEQIRAKQAAKPAMSPLPGAYPDREQPAPVAVVLPDLDDHDRSGQNYWADQAAQGRPYEQQLREACERNGIDPGLDEE